MSEDNFHFYVYDTDDVLVSSEHRHNTVTTVGKQNTLYNLYIATGIAPIRYLEFGSGSTAPAVTDTALVSSSGNRISLSMPTVNATYGVATFSYSISAGNTTWSGKKFNEAGLFNSSSGAPMYARVVFGPYTKSNDQYFVMNWVVAWNP